MKLSRSTLWAPFATPLSGEAVAILAVASTLTVCGAWGVFATLTELPRTFVPSPLAVLTAGKGMLSDGFAWDIGASTMRILVAFLISAALAVPLGLLMGTYQTIDAVFEPVVDFLRYVPVPSLLPLFVLWAGIGEGPKFLVLFAGTFLQLIVLVRDSTRAVPVLLYDAARTLGARDGQLLRGVTIPYLLPTLYDHLRVTLGWCWTYLVIAELIAVDRGVGFVIKEAQRFSAGDRLFVCFLTLGAIGLLTDTIMKQLRPVVFPYTRSDA
jgi:NitT/TauT family transport system permease protein